MRNPYTTPADFWRERDFGAKISAVFEFMDVHWRPLGKCLVYFVLPCALLMGIGMGLSANSMYNQIGRQTAGWHTTVGGPTSTSLFSQFNIGGIVVGFLGSMLSFLLLIGTVYGYVRARLHLPATATVAPAAVWAEIRARLGSLLLLIGLLLGFILIGAVAVVLFGFFSFVGAGGPLILLLLAFPLWGGALAYLGVVLSLFFPILWLEERSIFTAVGRCFQLVKGHWWGTFGLLLVASLIQGMLGFVFVIPQYAVLFGKMMHVPGLSSDVLELVAQCIYAVGIMFTYTIPLLALAFQYFHLAEQKEGWGLRLLVDTLGQPQAIPVAQSGHFRPNDEGEY